jgi:hypothetical protein
MHLYSFFSAIRTITARERKNYNINQHETVYFGDIIQNKIFILEIFCVEMRLQMREKSK